MKNSNMVELSSADYFELARFFRRRIDLNEIDFFEGYYEDFEGKKLRRTEYGAIVANMNTCVLIGNGKIEGSLLEFCARYDHDALYFAEDWVKDDTKILTYLVEEVSGLLLRFASKRLQRKKKIIRKQSKMIRELSNSLTQHY